jgi:hypothetical protein
MSYQVNTLRPGGRSGANAGAGATGAADAADRPQPSHAARGTPYREEHAWGQALAFAAGIAVGALMGAGAALLTAPQTGIETRLHLKQRARRARVQAEDRWDDLGRELRAATRRRKRKVRRGLAEKRWRVADAVEA